MFCLHRLKELKKQQQNSSYFTKKHIAKEHIESSVDPVNYQTLSQQAAKRQKMEADQWRPIWSSHQGLNSETSDQSLTSTATAVAPDGVPGAPAAAAAAKCDQQGGGSSSNTPEPGAGLGDEAGARTGQHQQQEQLDHQQQQQPHWLQQWRSQCAPWQLRVHGVEDLLEQVAKMLNEAHQPPGAPAAEGSAAAAAAAVPAGAPRQEQSTAAPPAAPGSRAPPGDAAGGAGEGAGGPMSCTDGMLHDWRLWVRKQVHVEVLGMGAVGNGLGRGQQQQPRVRQGAGKATAAAAAAAVAAAGGGAQHGAAAAPRAPVAAAAAAAPMDTSPPNSKASTELAVAGAAAGTAAAATAAAAAAAAPAVTLLGSTEGQEGGAGQQQISDQLPAGPASADDGDQDVVMGDAQGVTAGHAVAAAAVFEERALGVALYPPAAGSAGGSDADAGDATTAAAAAAAAAGVPVAVRSSCRRRVVREESGTGSGAVTVNAWGTAGGQEGALQGAEAAAVLGRGSAEQVGKEVAAEELLTRLARCFPAVAVVTAASPEASNAFTGGEGTEAVGKAGVGRTAAPDDQAGAAPSAALDSMQAPLQNPEEALKIGLQQTACQLNQMTLSLHELAWQLLTGCLLLAETVCLPAKVTNPLLQLSAKLPVEKLKPLQLLLLLEIQVEQLLHLKAGGVLYSSSSNAGSGWGGAVARGSSGAAKAAAGGAAGAGSARGGRGGTKRGLAGTAGALGGRTQAKEAAEERVVEGPGGGGGGARGVGKPPAAPVTGAAAKVAKSKADAGRSLRFTQIALAKRSDSGAEESSKEVKAGEGVQKRRGRGPGANAGDGGSGAAKSGGRASGRQRKAGAQETQQQLQQVEQQIKQGEQLANRLVGLLEGSWLTSAAEAVLEGGRAMLRLELLLQHGDGHYQQRQQQWEQERQQQLRKDVMATAKSGRAVPLSKWLAVAKLDTVNHGLWPSWPSQQVQFQQQSTDCKTASSCILLHTPSIDGAAATGLPRCFGAAASAVNLAAGREVTAAGTSSMRDEGEDGFMQLQLLRYLWAYSTLQEMGNSLVTAEAAAKKCLRLCEQQQEQHQQQQQLGLGDLPAAAAPGAGVLVLSAMGRPAPWSCQLLASSGSSPISVEGVQQKLRSMGLARVLQLAGAAIEAGQYKEAVEQLQPFCNSTAGEGSVGLQ